MPRYVYCYEQGQFARGPYDERPTPSRYLQVREATPKECLFDLPRPTWDLHDAKEPRYHDGKIVFIDERDRKVEMRPGRYLAANVPALTPKEVEGYVQWLKDGTRPMGLLEGQVCFAMTPDEIERVYDDGPASCMRGESCVRIYGAGDLAIAYFVHNEEITARTLCWPEKKIYTTFYGAHEDELQARLIAEGFASHRVRSMDGARLLKDGDTMPYLDVIRVTDCGDHWIVDRNGQTNGNTHGTMYREAEYTCEECEEDCDDTYTVYAPREQEWCRHCYNNNTFFCEGTQRTYSCDAVEQYGNYTLDYARENNLIEDEAA
jgi:hypothetical protein